MAWLFKQHERTTTHAIVANDSIDVSHSVVASILRTSDGDGARVTLLVDLNVGTGTPLQLLDSITLLSNHTTDHRPWARHRLAGPEAVLQTDVRLVKIRLSPDAAICVAPHLLNN